MAKNNKTSVTSSDWNLETLSTKQLSSHLFNSIQAKSNVCIVGRRGSGKTEIAKQQIAAAGCEEVYLNLSVVERVDLGGYPDIMGGSSGREFVKFLLPSFYEKMMDTSKNAKPVVALLDEVDKADPSLWAPLLEFTQFHSINGIKLPNLKAVIMTGNLLAEGGARPSAPLLDRAEKYLVEPDAQAWIDWSGASGKIHPSIVAFIQEHNSELFGNVDLEENYADASPRGWAGASKLIEVGEELGWNSDMINAKVCGRVGKTAGIKYRVYYDHYHDLLPLVEQVFEGKDVASKVTTMAPTKQYVIALMVCSRISNAYLNSKVSAADRKKLLPASGKFLSKMSPEICLIAIRGQITLANIIAWNLDEQPDWKAAMAKVETRVKGSAA